MQQQITAYIKRELKFSDYEVEMIQYVALCLFYELSKALIFGIFFNYIGMLPEYLCSILLLAFLRWNIGGYHCNHYWSCFVVSFVMIALPVLVLPLYAPPIAPKIISLVLGMIVLLKFGPVESEKRPPQTENAKKNHTIKGSIILIGCIILCLVFPKNHLILIAYWTTIVILCQYIAMIINKQKITHIKEH